VRRSSIGFVAFAPWLALGSSGPASAQPPVAHPRLEIEAVVDPVSHGLRCKALIRDAGVGSFSLARGLTVERLTADGKPARYRRESAEAGTEDRVSVESAPGRELAIEYSGRILAEAYPPLTSLVNKVSEGLVELASYVGWYPKLEGAGAFEWQLTVDVPVGFVTVTNGRLESEKTLGARERTTWTSLTPTSDVLLLAAPGLRRSETVRGDVTVEVYGTRLPEDYLASMRGDLVRALDLLSETIGAPSPTRLVRVAYSPRPGWGYVRTPLIVVSEDGALAQRGEPFGPARDFRYIVHEVAHYWWHLADAGSPEDWINEGFSEYMALLASEAIVGKEFVRELQQEYLERSQSSATTPAILETGNDSPHRELNRYARPVLLLSELRDRCGSERTTRFIASAYRRFAREGRATTAVLLDEAAKSLGPDAAHLLSEGLHRTQWPGAQPLPKYAYSPKDAAFLGTWTGRLTQAGATHRVVLHLVVNADALVATMGSPDQGVQDIPVPEVGIESGVLRFRLGGFGVSFEGRLDGAGTTLAGTWKQGGSRFPLTLSKATPGD
jgi:hypothetical protein